MSSLAESEWDFEHAFQWMMMSVLSGDTILELKASLVRKSLSKGLK